VNSPSPEPSPSEGERGERQKKRGFWNSFVVIAEGEKYMVFIIFIVSFAVSFVGFPIIIPRLKRAGIVGK